MLGAGPLAQNANDAVKVFAMLPGEHLEQQPWRKNPQRLADRA